MPAINRRPVAAAVVACIAAIETAVADWEMNRKEFSKAVAAAIAAAQQRAAPSPPVVFGSLTDMHNALKRLTDSAAAPPEVTELQRSPHYHNLHAALDAFTSVVLAICSAINRLHTWINLDSRRNPWLLELPLLITLHVGDVINTLESVRDRFSAQLQLNSTLVHAICPHPHLPAMADAGISADCIRLRSISALQPLLELSHVNQQLQLLRTEATPLL
jgi:hypothetical protein